MRAEARFRPCSSPKAMKQGQRSLRLRLNSGAVFRLGQKILTVVLLQHFAGRMGKRGTMRRIPSTWREHQDGHAGGREDAMRSRGIIRCPHLVTTSAESSFGP